MLTLTLKKSSSLKHKNVPPLVGRLKEFYCYYVLTIEEFKRKEGKKIKEEDEEEEEEQTEISLI